MNFKQETTTIAAKNSAGEKWHHSLMDPMVLIFLILIATYILSLIVPAGSFERVLVNGRTRVVPDSFEFLENVTRLHPFSIFVAVPRGLIDAALYLFIVFIAGGLFNVLQRTAALENLIGVTVFRLGLKRRNLVIVFTTFLYGFFGIAVGFENNIALVPVAALIASALGCSPMVGAMIAVGGIGVGFALSPINVYTVGVAQNIGELELYSGYWLRILSVLSTLTLLCVYICKKIVPMIDDEEGSQNVAKMSRPLSEYRLSSSNIWTLAVFLAGLALMLFGIFRYKWYINEIAAVFLLTAMVIAIVNRWSAIRFVEEMLKGASGVTAGALVIGLAASIKVILTDAQIIDTIIYYLSVVIGSVPTGLAAIVASVVQGVINLFVPSGSGQALITMPILIPLADLIGMSRQLMISAFQIGDGLTNLIVPTSGGTLAMLALSGVSFAKWLKAIMPFMVLSYLLSWVILIIGTVVGY